MKKLLAIVVLGLLWCNVSFARIDYGCGPLKFTETAVKHFHEYLTFKKKNWGAEKAPNQIIRIGQSIMLMLTPCCL